jgi:hypothetical protein
MALVEDTSGSEEDYSSLDEEVSKSLLVYLGPPISCRSRRIVLLFPSTLDVPLSLILQ